MTLKNSFWIRVRENGRRRTWTWILQAAIFFMIIPINLTMQISLLLERAKLDKGVDIAAYCQEIVTINPILSFMICLFALMVGIQGYSYLHNQMKVDMYHSQPVKKETRFFSIYINGILTFMCPYVINLIIGCMIAVGYKVFSGSMFVNIVYAVVFNFVLFLAVYHISILATLLTNSIVISVILATIFMVYEGIWNVIGDTFAQYTMNHNMSGEHFYITPVLNMLFSSGDIGSQESLVQKIYDSWFLLLVAFLVSMLILGLSFFAYIKRRGEACKNAIAFEWTKIAVKVMVLIPTGILTFLIYMSYFDFANIYNADGTGFDFGSSITLFGMVVGFIVMFIVNGIIELVYEKDLKAILQHWKSFVLISAGTVVIVICSFQNWFGLFDKAPSKNNVKDVAIYLAYDSNKYGLEGNLKKMKYKNLDVVYQLIDASLADKEAGKYLNGESDGIEEGVRNDTTYHKIEIAFHMKIGTTVYRRYYVNVKNNAKALDTIFSSEEYLKQQYSILFKKYNSEKDIYFDAYNGEDPFSCNISKENLKEVKDILWKDLKNTSYSQLCAETTKQIGTINSMEGDENIAIYNTFENFRNWLMEHHNYGFDKKDFPKQIRSVTCNEEYIYDRDVIEELYQNALAVEKQKEEDGKYTTVTFVEKGNGYCYAQDVNLNKLSKKALKAIGYDDEDEKK